MTTQQTATRVGVHVSGCRREDADAVFDLLAHVFPVAPEEPPRRLAGRPEAAVEHPPTVWAITVDAHRPAPEAAPAARPAGPVIVDLYGTDPPVNRVRNVLERAFGVLRKETVPGDQELEVRLRLGASRG